MPSEYAEHRAGFTALMSEMHPLPIEEMEMLLDAYVHQADDESFLFESMEAADSLRGIMTRIARVSIDDKRHAVHSSVIITEILGTMVHPASSAFTLPVIGFLEVRRREKEAHEQARVLRSAHRAALCCMRFLESAARKNPDVIERICHMHGLALRGGRIEYLGLWIDSIHGNHADESDAA